VGILLEGLEDYDPFCFGIFALILEGDKYGTRTQNAWIIHPQPIAKYANSRRNQSLVTTGINVGVT
jgi:hypothetical protein